MKSDREFIDGIYEKAKQYTTEENMTSLTTYKRKTGKSYMWQTLSCAAALLLLCVAIDGITGTKILQKNNSAKPTATEQDMGVAFARSMPGQEEQTVLVTGEISEVTSEEGTFLLIVETMSEVFSGEAEESASDEEMPEVIQVLYDTNVYASDEFLAGEKITLEVCVGDKYGMIAESQTETDYPVYTLQ